MATKAASVRVQPPKATDKTATRKFTRTELFTPTHPFVKEIHADARNIPLEDNSVDLVVTSPPYWRKRNYGFPNQIGQEATPQEYVQNLISSLREWRRVLSKWGSVFLNIGDTYWNRSLAGIPGRLESSACDDGWVMRNRIIWR